MNIWWLATSKNKGHCSYHELKNRQTLAQGWPAIGDLSALLPIKDEKYFRETINTLVKDVYNGLVDKRNPGRILLNLLRFRVNDLVLCTEGINVKGIAKVGRNPTYRYDNGDGLFEYAHSVYPVSEWQDWEIQLVGPPPHPSATGPIGINYYKGNEQFILNAWEKLKFRNQHAVKP